MKYENVVKMWQEKNIQTVADLDTALDNYKILFAYHSNKIEGSDVTLHQTREIFENGKVIGYTGDLRALYETQNQKLCYEFLKPFILEKKEMDLDFIKEVHGHLMQGCYDETRWEKGERPGAFKKHDYIVGDDVGARAEEVEEELLDLCQQIRDAKLESVDQVLTAAAFFHCSFECIHPFADGNGRAGRTLMNYFLMLHDVPPTILYDEDKESYYMALTVFEKAGKLSGFVQFLKEQTVKTWKSEKTGLRRLEDIEI